MPELRIDGRTLHYLDQGRGPAVLLLHAFPLSSEMWTAQLEHLARAGRRVIAPDHPGFGRSDPGEGTMASYARAAVALLDALKIDRAAVAGLSMGGYAAFELQARHPDRVTALMLCDTRAGTDTEEGKKGREASARAVEQSGSGVLVEKMLGSLLSPKATPTVRGEVERMIRAAPPAGVAAALRGMAVRRDFLPRLGEVRCPTLVVCGADDTLTPPAESHKMAEGIPGAKLELIADAGHLANLEQPGNFNRALEQFLATVP